MKQIKPKFKPPAPEGLN